MAEWKECTIGDLCNSVSDTYRGKDEKVVLINTSDVLEGKVLNHKVVENKKLKGQFKKTFKKSDILYSEIRPINKRFAFVDFDETSNYIASTKLMVLRHKDNVLPEFLFVLLKSNYVIAELQHLAETRSGTFPQITFSSELAPMKVNLPNKETQKKIVSVLSCIEQKMSTNELINNNLEQQAQALYQELFVKNASSEWKIGTISDLGTVIGGSTPSKSKPEYYTERGIAWITPKDLSVNKSKFVARGENDITELGLKNSSASIMQRGTVLFSSRAPIGYIAIAAGEVTTNQGFKSVVPNPEIGTPFIYHFLKANLPIIEGMASGSTFKEVSGSTMKIVPALIPDEETLAKFNEFCTPLFEQQRVLEEQNRALSSMRDSLLPKLMSGDIDVSKVDI
ncbi:MAG: restriction endonuclease subunit S [Lachnospiraceae bacterium]|nr:restriction endonuclease subunit S [Lachnospiraceae bacterium]